MQALYWNSFPKNKVKCLLCPHKCLLSSNKKGLCCVRLNDGGTMKSLIDCKVASLALDPIEKKPLYHFYPSSQILSAGTLGCNFSCVFCQNHTLSHFKDNPEKVCRSVTPEELCNIALRYKPEGNIGIAYTYNEPSVWYEFVLESSKLTKQAGLKNVLVTNGFLNQEPLNALIPYIDAVNVDIKSISPQFYKKYCRGTLRNVLDYCKTAAQKCHIEITNLVIPSLNDSQEDIVKLAKWIAKNLGKDAPLHLSAYRPQFKMSLPSTPADVLEKSRDLALKFLSYVYIGNIYIKNSADTFCPVCKRLLIERKGFGVLLNKQQGTNCPFCSCKINVIKGDTI